VIDSTAAYPGTWTGSGVLEVQFPSGTAAQGDRISILTDSLIGVDGTTVTYAGTPIGTLPGGLNGSSLRIELNESITNAALNALLQHLTYELDLAQRYRPAERDFVDCPNGVQLAGGQDGESALSAGGRHACD
jgi:hypothetical protein